ncbi:MAG TPA: hypothetical protein VM198_13760 [Longimicrobiales bacterium]|nr:hypothetical protein [Longimicrobiales bacterium]
MQPDQVRAAEAALNGTLADVIAIIESAKARDGRGTLEKHIARMLPEAEASDVREAADVAMEVIESIPVFLARARQESEERGLGSIVDPLLDRAQRYYLQPLDLIPEMTQGLVGLLDDSYLVIRTLQNLDKGPQPFLDWDLDYPARFLQRLIGVPIAQRLDQIATEALEEVSTHLEEVWRRSAHHA